MQNKTKSIVYKLIFVLAVFAMVPLFGGPGAKIGLWAPMTGFRMTVDYMAYSAVAALIVLFMLLMYLLKDFKKSILSFVALVVFAFAGYVYGVNQEPQDWTGVRGVRDISTDIQNLPEFRALLDAPGRTNSFEYDPETADRQKEKFPWVKPIISELDQRAAYDLAIDVAKEFGWHITGEQPSQGRFEATDYTKWFHFNDDLVVRISADPNGSKIDIRSSSRVGGSDHGLGAIRIMKFTKEFNAH